MTLPGRAQAFHRTLACTFFDQDRQDSIASTKDEQGRHRSAERNMNRMYDDHKAQTER
jgi:hypothetical protein